VEPPAPAEMPSGVTTAPPTPATPAVETTAPLTEQEISFLEEVAVTLVDSLRDVKRLANCYQILRTTLLPEQLELLIGNRAATGGHLAAITQLAIVIAAPLSAARYVELLGQAASLDNLMKSADDDLSIQQHERDVIRYLLMLYRQWSGTIDLDGLRAWVEVAARHSFTVPPTMAAKAAHMAG
jgi:hypothetical protein